MYADFRPSVDGWGKRGPVSCETILSLRKINARGKSDDSKGDPAPNVIEFESTGEIGSLRTIDEVDMQPLKKPRRMLLDEYDAALDADIAFDDAIADFDP